MKTFIPILIALLLSSCVTEEKCQTRYPCTTGLIEKDSIGKPTVSKEKYDSLLAVKNRSGEDIQYSNCDSLEKALDKANGTITTLKNGVRTTMTGGTGKPIKCNCATDSLLALLELEREKTITPHYKTIVRTVRADCKLEHLTKWDSFFIRSGQVFWLILLIIVAWQILKRLPV